MRNIEGCENLAFQSQYASLARITRYAGRVARHVFVGHAINPSFISSKAAAMAIYEYVTGERLPQGANKAKDSAIRMEELVLSTHDFEIIQDLR